VLFLSDEWFDALDAAVSTVEVPEGVALRIGQVITGGPDGEVTYSLDCRNGLCTLLRGTIDDADVVFRSDVATAQDLADGDSSTAPGHAVLRGDVQVSGDVTRLLAAGDLAARLATAMAGFRELHS
jgi:hypothetical protein